MDKDGIKNGVKNLYLYNLFVSKHFLVETNSRNLNRLRILEYKYVCYVKT